MLADLTAAAVDVADLCGAKVTVTASIAHELRNGPAIVVSALEFAADAAIGATSISLRLPSDATGLTGQVPKGLAITIAGETTKTAATDARAEGDVIVIPLTAGLAAAHSEGDAVTIAATATFTCPDAIDQAVSPFSGNLIEIASGELIIPMAGASALFRLRPDLVLTITNPNGGGSRTVKIVTAPQVFQGGAWSVYYAG